MIKFSSSKKGVSPLIATILLIAFAVALGSVVMNWGLNLDLGKPGDRCRSIEFKIRSIDGLEVCFGGLGQSGYINFVIDNIGASDISGVSIWMVGDKGTKLFDIDNIMIKKDSLFERKDKSVNYDFLAYGNLKQVQFIPKVKSEQSTEICPKNAIKAEKLGPCA